MFFFTLLMLSLIRIGISRRMVGGRVDMLGEYPYVVRIGHRQMQRIVESRRADNLCNESRKVLRQDCIMFRTQELYDQEWRVTRTCTGSVLKPKWTLTAGHCLPPKMDSKNGAVIQYGDFSDYAMTRSITPVEAVHYHPNTKLLDFNGYLQLYNDVGLIQHGNIKITTYGKISAVESGSLFGQNILMAGLGNMKSGREAVDLQIMDVITKKCEDENLKIRVFPAICVARRCHTKGGICEGDSGGPLIHPSGIVGVSSLGLVNCEIKKTGFAGTATAVSPYIKWIQSFMTEIERKSGS